MNSRFARFERLWIAVSTICFGTALLASAASKQTNVPAAKRGSSATAANAAAAAVEIPKSVFTAPSNEKEGKDPFFPRSKRPYADLRAPVPPKQVSPVSELRINGTSGSEERPLVIINNVTFGVGDTGEVMAAGRKIKVQCIEIDLAAGTALIQAGDERRTLRFRRSDGK